MNPVRRWAAGWVFSGVWRVSAKHHIGPMTVAVLGTPEQPVLARMNEAIELLLQYDQDAYGRLQESLHRLIVADTSPERVFPARHLLVLPITARQLTARRLAAVLAHYGAIAQLEMTSPRIAQRDLRRKALEAELSFVSHLPNSWEEISHLMELLKSS